MKFELHHGDCLDVLKTLADCSVDAIVTDPPYGLGKEPDPVKVMAAWVSQGYFEVEGSGFMGKKWDAFVPQPIIWKEVFRVLKPGGHLLAFAGTRTQDWMAMSLRFAGFEIRDMIAWVYGSGFPKSMDLSKAIDKRGGNIPWQAEFAEHLRAIKPAGMRATEISSHVANGSKSNFWGHFIDTKCQPLLPTLEQYRKLRELLPIDPAWDQHFLPEAEREVVGKKRTGDPVSWYAESVRGDGVVDITAPATEAAKQWEGWGTALKPALEPITLARKPLIGTVAANVLEHGTGGLNIDGCRVGRDADDVSGWSQTGSKTSENRAMSGGNYARDAKPDAEGRWPANFIHDGSEEVLALFPEVGGGKFAERTTPANRADTYSGFDGCSGKVNAPNAYGDSGSAARFFYCAKASRDDRDEGLPMDQHSSHPTVKPTDLMRYLCRLIAPPNGIVLDPFTGSGSTGKAAMAEGFRFIGIEREAEYIEIARARISAEAEKPRQLSLF